MTDPPPSSQPTASPPTGHDFEAALQAASARGSYRAILAETAHRQDPEDESVRLHLAQVLFAAGDLPAAHAQADLVTRFGIDWDRRVAGWRIAVATAAYSPDLDVLDLRALTQRWSGHLTVRRLERQPPAPVPRARGRTPWVAYLLTGLPTGSRFLPLDGHDGDRIVARTYWRGLGPAPDPRMIDLSALSPAAAADRIRQDDQDILVDLSSEGERDFDLLAIARPARVQIAWFNRLLPVYDPGHDWLLGDVTLCGGSDLAVGEGASRHLLPVPVVPFAAPEPNAAPPGHRGRHPTLGTLPDAALADAEALAFWAGLLAELPQARFVLTASRMTDLIAERILAAFERRGIEPERITLAVGRRLGEGPSRVDLLLDAPTLSGTAFDTLAACRAGVPVLAACGDRQPRRRAAAILTAIDQGDLVVPMAGDGPARFKGAALALATDPHRLDRLRRLLPEAVASSGIADPDRSIARLEEGLTEIWRAAVARVDG